jgi:cobalt-zinc-cadmium efflux system protein
MMEGIPSCLRLEEVSATICSVPGVIQVHDLHVWGVCSEHIILSAHAVIDDIKISQAQMIMDEMKRTLKEKFEIEHTTIQLEGKSCGQGVVVCSMDNLH